jgi:hypothetical protein
MLIDRFSSSCKDFATSSLMIRIRFEMQREKTRLLWKPSILFPKNTKAETSKPVSRLSLKIKNGKRTF